MVKHGIYFRIWEGTLRFHQSIYLGTELDTSDLWSKIYCSINRCVCMCVFMSSGQSAHHIRFLSVFGKCFSCCHGLPTLCRRRCKWRSLTVTGPPWLMILYSLFRLDCRDKRPAKHHFQTAFPSSSFVAVLAGSARSDSQFCHCQEQTCRCE